MKYPKDYSLKPVEEFYQEAVIFIRKMKRVSASMLQRHYGLGYAKSAYLIQLMEKRGVISEPDSNWKRKVIKLEFKKIE